MKKSHWILLLCVSAIAVKAQNHATQKPKITMMNYYHFENQLIEGNDQIALVQWYSTMNHVMSLEKGKSSEIFVYTPFNSLNNFIVNQIVQLPVLDSTHYYGFFKDLPYPLNLDTANSLFLATYRWAKSQPSSDLKRLIFSTYRYSFFGDEKQHDWLYFDSEKDGHTRSKWYAALIHCLKPYQGNPKVQMYCDAIQAQVNYSKYGYSEFEGLNDGDNAVTYDNTEYRRTPLRRKSTDESEESLMRVISGSVDNDISLLIKDLPTLRKELSIDTLTGIRKMNWNFAEAFMHAVDDNKYDQPIAERNSTVTAYLDIFNYIKAESQKLNTQKTCYLFFDASTFWDSTLLQVKNDTNIALNLGKYEPFISVAPDFCQFKLWSDYALGKFEIDKIFIYDTTNFSNKKFFLNEAKMLKFREVSNKKGVSLVHVDPRNILKLLEVDSAYIADYTFMDEVVEEGVPDTAMYVGDDDYFPNGSYTSIYNYGRNLVISGGLKNVWLDQSKLEPDYRSGSFNGLSGMQLAQIELSYSRTHYYEDLSPNVFNLFANVGLMNKDNSRLMVHQIGFGWTEYLLKKFCSFSFIQRVGMSLDKLTLGDASVGNITAPPTLHRYTKNDLFSLIGVGFQTGYKVFELGIQGGYQFDLSKGEWSINDLAIPYQQKLTHTGFYTQVSLSIKLL